MISTEIKEEITSYAYCYKTLILKSLMNSGVKSNDDVKSCLNCLKELSKYIFDKDYGKNLQKSTFGKYL